jgi:hypothetical protein
VLASDVTDPIRISVLEPPIFDQKNINEQAAADRAAVAVGERSGIDFRDC